MTDEELLRSLHSFGIDEASRDVLVLLPVVWVAWADGSIQPEERELIARIATQNMHLGPEGQRVLDNWLAWAPGHERVERAAALLLAFSTRARVSPHADVIEFSQKVAEAAGPFFGKVAAPEREALESVAQSLAVEPHVAWERIQSRLVVESMDPMSEGWFDEEVTNPGIARRPSPRKVEDRPVPPASGPPGLVWMVGPDEQCRELVATLSIGRGRDNDLQMSHDSEMSRHHCVFERREAGVYVRDLGALNGTVVEGERVTERKLFGGEVVVLGETALRWRV